MVHVIRISKLNCGEQNKLLCVEGNSVMIITNLTL